MPSSIATRRDTRSTTATMKNFGISSMNKSLPQSSSLYSFWESDSDHSEAENDIPPFCDLPPSSGSPQSCQSSSAFTPVRKRSINAIMSEDGTQLRSSVKRPKLFDACPLTDSIATPVSTKKTATTTSVLTSNVVFDSNNFVTPVSPCQPSSSSSCVSQASSLSLKTCKSSSRASSPEEVDLLLSLSSVSPVSSVAVSGRSSPAFDLSRSSSTVPSPVLPASAPPSLSGLIKTEVQEKKQAATKRPNRFAALSKASLPTLSLPAVALPALALGKKTLTGSIASSVSLISTVAQQPLLAPDELRAYANGQYKEVLSLMSRLSKKSSVDGDVQLGMLNFLQFLSQSQ